MPTQRTNCQPIERIRIIKKLLNLVFLQRMFQMCSSNERKRADAWKYEGTCNTLCFSLVWARTHANATHNMLPKRAHAHH